MLSKTLFISALFFASALGSSLNERHADAHGLAKRDEKFVPTTHTAQGDTCAEAFGTGYITCREITPSRNRLCYNPDLGQTCCESEWACPSGSFCFLSPFCCPEGQDPKTCAANNGFSLTNSFKAPLATGKAVSGNKTASVTKVYNTNDTAAYAPTATGTYAAPTPTKSTFTGAADPMARVGYGAAALVGVAGVMGL
ncbi:hypothetical protein EJ06DRAFT_527862, partial [Trichodelitschia bisporula]